MSPVIGSVNWVKLLARAAKPELAEPRNLNASEIWVSDSALKVLRIEAHLPPVSLKVTPRSDRLWMLLVLVGFQ